MQDKLLIEAQDPEELPLEHHADVAIKSVATLRA